MNSMMDSKFLQVEGRIDHVNNTVDNLVDEMDNLGQNVSKFYYQSMKSDFQSLTFLI